MGSLYVVLTVLALLCRAGFKLAEILGPLPLEYWDKGVSHHAEPRI